MRRDCLTDQSVRVFWKFMNINLHSLFGYKLRR